MANDIFLEVEGASPSWIDLRNAAEKTGVIWPEHDDSKAFYGNFSRSGMFFWTGGGGENREPRQPTAEGQHECHFLTRYTIVFRINSSKYDECVADIKTFLTRLTMITPMQFVLSFQLEEVYAIRDHKRGFQWFWNEPR